MAYTVCLTELMIDYNLVIINADFRLTEPEFKSIKEVSTAGSTGTGLYPYTTSLEVSYS